MKKMVLRKETIASLDKLKLTVGGLYEIPDDAALMMQQQREFGLIISCFCSADC